MVPAHAVSTALYPASYPLRFISGTMILPIAETVASDDPDNAPKNIEATATTAPKPPVIEPRKLAAKSTSLFAIPPKLMIVPARIKNGIANSEKESIPVTQYCVNTMISTSENNSNAIIVAPPMLRPTGTEIVTNTISDKNTMNTSTYATSPLSFTKILITISLMILTDIKKQLIGTEAYMVHFGILSAEVTDPI